MTNVTKDKFKAIEDRKRYAIVYEVDGQYREGLYAATAEKLMEPVMRANRFGNGRKYWIEKTNG